MIGSRILKLFNLKEKEEAAWQAAEIIVKDVIAITLRRKSFEVSSRVPSVNVT